MKVENTRLSAIKLLVILIEVKAVFNNSRPLTPLDSTSEDGDQV